VLLKSFLVKNIRSFREDTLVEFKPDLNILVGPNGGGKSNLLDTITIVLRHFFLKGWSVNVASDQFGQFKQITTPRLFEDIQRHLPRFLGEDSPSWATIVFEITSDDLEAMSVINKCRKELREALLRYRNGTGHEAQALNEFKLELFAGVTEISYTLQNGGLSATTASDAAIEYLRFLNVHELHLLLAEDAGISLAAQYLYFSPFRGAATAESFEANLSGVNRSDVRFAYQGATSRLNTSLIQLATLHFGFKRRQLESSASEEGFAKRWESDPEVASITKFLAKVGYAWSLDTIDSLRNIYRIGLHRNETHFDVAQASTGEQEIINYLFGLFAFGLKGGLLIVDEVELHLHPKWQVLLLDLIGELAQSTKNQVIVSTHSPAFITPKSVRNVIRVFRDSTRTSRVRRLTGDESSVRDMLHVVNSHNNERMFFADTVVLVEGLMDRILFQRLIDRKVAATDNTRVIEVLEVHGKSNFDRYRDFLEKFGVTVFVIADLDYLLDVGKNELGDLFDTDWQGMDQKTLRDKKSVDRRTLSEAIEGALSSRDLKDVARLWEYIKTRRTQLKSDLSDANKIKVATFLSEKREAGVIILRKGEIEDYLPEGKRDVDGVIALTSAGEFDQWLSDSHESENAQELLEIVSVVSA
jgi:predicted ATPase